VVKGRAALGISADPGSVANTVWYSLSGQAGPDVYRIGSPWSRK
jgi:hypothetical protein